MKAWFKTECSQIINLRKCDKFWIQFHEKLWCVMTLYLGEIMIIGEFEYPKDSCKYIDEIFDYFKDLENLDYE
jgi:hypothetical protein